MCFLQVYFQLDGHVEKREREPFTLTVDSKGREEVRVTVRVGFQSHYGEPPLDLPLVVQSEKGECVYVCVCVCVGGGGCMLKVCNHAGQVL